MLELPTRLWKEYKFPICMIAGIVGVLYLSSLRDAATKKPVRPQSGSVCWNEYRKKWVLIAVEKWGSPSMLGEVWYSEANHPEGPWLAARKIITHANKKDDAHDFYNPTQHSFFDREGGRVIYLEGSYVNTFSGNPHPTPYYEYNQINYRLDLSDPRLKLPTRTPIGHFQESD